MRDFVASMGRAAGPGRFEEPVDVDVSVAALVGVGELVERAESMSVLRDLLAGVRSSSKGRLVLVRGEAGVGKTALLRRFCETLGKPVVVLWAGCEPLRTPRPLGPLLDVAEVVGGEFEELVAGVARPHDVALALLRQLRSGRPTVLVLEDVHWADEATLDVLTLLARRIANRISRGLLITRMGPGTSRPCCDGRRWPPRGPRRPARIARRSHITPLRSGLRTACRSRGALSCSRVVPMSAS